MIKLNLTNKESKALKELIYNSNACSSGCIYPHMQESKKDCDECEFTKSIHSITKKIDGE